MRILLSVFFTLVMAAYLPGQSLTEVRKQFHAAVIDPEQVESYYSFIIEVKDTLPTYLAYKAAAEAMMAQNIWNPLGKFSRVSRFDNLIQEAIEKDPKNLEIHFLRFAIQYHLPRFLMMSKHLEEDRDFIVENLWQCQELNLDSNFERYITYFMNETGMLRPEQVEMIKTTLKPKSAR